MTDRSPSRAQIFKEALAASLADLRVCLPGKVESFDAVKQIADIQPQLKRRLQAEDGTVSHERLPVIRGVPVVYQRAGGYYFYAPLQKGDHVVLHFADYSLDEWFEQGRESSPKFAHAHDLTDCFAVPGGYPKTKALSGVGTDDAAIGKEDGSSIVFKSNGEIHAGQGTPTEFVALAQKVKTRLDALMTIFQAWTPVAQDGGSALKIALSSGGWASVPTTQNDVAADKLKASG
jgi:hypothetical protein